jgi:hypothetical protein
VSASPSVLLDSEPHLYDFRLVLISIFAIELLVLLVLAYSSIACRTSALVAGVALHKIAAAIGGGVSVAKVQHPWKTVIRP